MNSVGYRVGRTSRRWAGPLIPESAFAGSGTITGLRSCTGYKNESINRLVTRLDTPPCTDVSDSHLLKTIPLLTVSDVQPHILVIDHSHLPQEQKEEGRILDQSRGFLHVGEWTEIGLHRRLLIIDEIGVINTVVVRTVNERARDRHPPPPRRSPSSLPRRERQGDRSPLPHKSRRDASMYERREEDVHDGGRGIGVERERDRGYEHHHS